MARRLAVPFVSETRYIADAWFRWLISLPFGEVLQDTRANRTNYPATANKNKLYLETDLGSTLVYVSDGTNWLYRGGSYRRTQAQIAAFVSTLGTNDAGVIIEVTDFLHRLRWSGSALDFAEGDHGSNYFIDAPAAPLGKLVQLCDGTATTYLKGDGTTGSYTTKNLTGHFRRSVTSGADNLAAAVAPGISGSVSSVTATNQANTTGITIADHPAHTHDDNSTLGTPDLFQADISGSGVSARTGNPSATLQHPVTDPGHNHTQDAHNHNVGTLAVNATGKPAAYEVLTYFVR
jgi:hypothetical protein